MTLRVIRFGLALLFSAIGAGLCHADCGALYALAQQHAYDMAFRNSLDHSGFMRHRGPAGAVAENVAVGCETEKCARRMWTQSPRHRANMMLGGCQTVASAVSASGRRYWVMEIGVAEAQAATFPSKARRNRALRPSRGPFALLVS